MMNRKTIFALAALLTMATTACSRSDDEPVPAENYSDAADRLDDQPIEQVSEAPAPEPLPTAAADTNMMADAPPEPAPAPDEQMMDDASATGMTSRTSRNETSSDEPGPAEQIEKK